MSLSKRLQNATEKRTSGPYTDSLIPKRPAFDSIAGVVVDAESAIRMSTVYSCVRLLADTV